ncbi:Rieske 2Fe-2S domain-containing protein [Nonomuraea sp. PA05]|uniref:Rieske 2Fe-2S domain-containing protein n=1 Tax=Nonomuraea sp. PA05 TaxID=2604466 RepID=UPI0011D72AA0|nr:Rieske 2Fe-2S domain-containing protein [Nonomuraea sp. PA05]TYB50770.1 Rieske 2Fe-2S domain-containing protein [Nonomuraea sp. PA05]
MRADHFAREPGPPPSFAEARNKRQRVRAAGLDPDYWYAVEYDRAVAPGQVVEARFWNRSIALYRGSDGQVRALENRCAHRQLKLSRGEVDGCHLTCTYHGWTYDGEGNVVHYAHDLFGRAQPEVRVRSYPVRVRHGLIWLFPGDPAMAAERDIPDIPEIEGPRPWARVEADFTWRAHHSMIIDNVSDFTHAYLHRKYRPFWDARLTGHELRGDRVFLSYDTLIGGGRISGLLVDRRRGDTTRIDLCFDYPYQRSDTGGIIKHWCFVLPIDRTTTRVFFIFYFDAFRIPFTPFRFPRWAMRPLLKLGGALSVRPLLLEDGAAVEAEQAGYERNHASPIVELNPAVHLFQDLTVRKWQDYLDRAGRGRA